ncbi:MAG: hypothetical protein QW076_00765 [Candidatus Anstonellales archaeon]
MKIDITKNSLQEIEKAINVFGTKNVYICRINNKSYLVEEIELEENPKVIVVDNQDVNNRKYCNQNTTNLTFADIVLL